MEVGDSIDMNDKVALVGIAKDEDNYIDEWIDYNLKLGFDDIFIYQNNRRAKLKRPNEHVHLLEFDGMLVKQVDSYNKWIDEHYNEFHWAAFFDIDEFLLLKNGMHNVHELVKKYNDLHAIKIFWRLFGDSNLKKVVDNNYSVIDRFICSARTLSTTPKTMINLAISKNMNKISAHICKPNEPIAINDADAEIAHYIVKTEEEYIKRKFNCRTLDTD